MEIEDVIAKAEGNIAALDKIKGNALTQTPSALFLKDFNKLLDNSMVVLEGEESALAQLPEKIESVDTAFDISNETPTYLDILCMSKQVSEVLQNYVVPTTPIIG